MSITLTGTIARQDFGFGIWAIVTEAGETYELKDPPQELCQERAKVRVEGRVRDDVMTMAMIGPVLEVSAFEFLD